MPILLLESIKIPIFGLISFFLLKRIDGFNNNNDNDNKMINLNKKTKNLKLIFFCLEISAYLNSNMVKIIIQVPIKTTDSFIKKLTIINT